VNGEEFLRGWATEVVAAGDQNWYQPLYALVEALEIVDAIDIDVARSIGQDIRTGLTARTGEETPDFFLRSRKHIRQWPARPVPRVSVRAALAPLPAAVARGGTNFASVDTDAAWLVCSGPGRAPWPEYRPPPMPTANGNPGGFTIEGGHGPPAPPFRDVLDNHGRHYRLSHGSSGASSSGEKRQRWDMRARMEPVPGDNVGWLEFVTEHGPVRADLRPSVPATAMTLLLDPAPSAIEYHLNAKVHEQVWLHLLDPDRPLEPLGVVPEALIAVGAIDPDHPLVKAILAVDAALAGDPHPTGMSDTLAAALQRVSTTAAWLGVEALGVPVELDGALVALEALVGHQDRLALHFIQSGAGADVLIVSATDDVGGGYVGHAEPLGGMEEGAFHLRPPLDPETDHVAVTLEGPAHRTTIDIDLGSARER
jgi:hypothetical protein